MPSITASAAALEQMSPEIPRIRLTSVADLTAVNLERTDQLRDEGCAHEPDASSPEPIGRHSIHRRTRPLP
jgi:hypothetical protein